jgi:hypothetical protein
MEKVNILKEEKKRESNIKEVADKISKNKTVNRVYFVCNLILGIIIGVGCTLVAFTYFN